MQCYHEFRQQYKAAKLIDLRITLKQSIDSSEEFFLFFLIFPIRFFLGWFYPSKFHLIFFWFMTYSKNFYFVRIIILFFLLIHLFSIVLLIFLFRVYQYLDYVLSLFRFVLFAIVDIHKYSLIYFFSSSSFSFFSFP